MNATERIEAAFKAAGFTNVKAVRMDNGWTHVRCASGGQARGINVPDDSEEAMSFAVTRMSEGFEAEGLTK